MPDDQPPAEDPPPVPAAGGPAFLTGGGEMGARMRAFNWHATALGPPTGWPAALRTTLRILLTTNHPVFLFWGPQHLCFYNDAYSRSLGPEKHPSILGASGHLAWPEIWSVIAPQITSVMAGKGATWHENQLLPITRHGRLEEVYWTYSYGPIDDDTAPGGIGGVMVLCTETTPQVLLSQRLRASEKRWLSMFDQAPGFICVLQGPEHRYEYANQRYQELVAARAIVGQRVLDCLPEVQAQGFIDLLDRVYSSGQPHVASAAPLMLQPSDGGPPAVRYLDFIYQPMRDTGGLVTGIFVEGHDVTQRTLAEQAMQSTLASIADGFVALDAEWRFIHVNPTAERLLRSSAEQLLGRNHWQQFRHTAGTHLEAEYRRAAAGELRTLEYFHAQWNRWFDIRCYPRTGGGVALYFQDVTEAKESRLALALSNQQARERAEELEAVMHSVPASIWIAHDAQCLRITGNPQSYRLLRMGEDHNASATAAEQGAVSRPFRELIGGVPAAAHQLPLQRATATGQATAPMEVSLEFADGDVRHIYGAAAPLRDEAGAVRGAVGAFVDITALKLAQSRLERRERELRTLADNTPDALARLDRAHRHVFANAAIEQSTGLTAAQILGRQPQELGLPAPLAALWNQALQDVFTSRRAAQFEFVSDRTGTPKTFVVRLVPELGADGAVEHVLAIVQDATEHRNTERALREGERRKDEFLATLAHELRNPLAPLRSGLNILQQAPNSPEAGRALAMMDRQVHHMVRLVDDLLDVSRISAGKLALRCAPVTLQQVAEAALEVSLPTLQASGHRVDVEFPPEPVWLHADLTRLAQVVGNLLNNAAKYTPRGGHVRLHLQADPSNGRAVLQVLDNGVGIAPEMLREVFEMFAQVAQHPEHAQSGLGVGLALARSIVALHQGSVQAHSEGPGLGSTFTVVLPLAAAPEPVPRSDGAAPEPAPPARAAGPGRRVLVVDDNRDAADSLALLISLSGHQVHTAYSAQQGLQAVRDWGAQVAFIDIGMPGMDGHAMARALRGQAANLLLVAVTGWGAELDEKRSREAGFDLHLTKPVAFAAVEAVLARLAPP